MNKRKASKEDKLKILDQNRETVKFLEQFEEKEGDEEILEIVYKNIKFILNSIDDYQKCLTIYPILALLFFLLIFVNPDIAMAAMFGNMIAFFIARNVITKERNKAFEELAKVGFPVDEMRIYLGI